MRNGVKLFTAVCVPKEFSQFCRIIMQRTPFSAGPCGVDNDKTVVGPSEAAEKEGFIFACQDVRGRYRRLRNNLRKQQPTSRQNTTSHLC